MGRTVDFAVGAGLFAVGAVPLAAGIVVSWLPLVAFGGVTLLLTLPFAYKLVRYPPTRRTPTGDMVAVLRRAKTGPFRPPGALVCFSGIDGSGKTTQAERLVEEFEDVGVDAVHVWARWRPFVSYPLMGLLFVTRGWRRKDYSKSATMRRIWGYFLLADQLAFFARYIWPHLLRGRVVCVDRYLLDQIVEMRYDDLYNRRAADLIASVLPSAAMTFVMDVTADVAADRKDDTQEMLDRLHVDEDARTYLRRRRELFLDAAEEFDVEVVDTTRPIDDTHEEVTDRAFEAYFEF